MTVNNMMMAVLKDNITRIRDSVFVQEFVEFPVQLSSQILNLGEHKHSALENLQKQVIKQRYYVVDDLAIALNEMIDRARGDSCELPIYLDEDVEWDGYLNATEEPVTVEIERGAKLNLLEFCHDPKNGFIFQITMGEGAEGHHFNMPMDNVLCSSKSLIEVIKKAKELREADAELEEIAQGVEDGGAWS
ncbi:hypothetical protein ABXV18_24610 [Vibrio owensii]|uniref:hypothetical protein n=1 Tax=Vibrio owensii TaxID=696485 RepID=UPI0033926418